MTAASRVSAVAVESSAVVLLAGGLASQSGNLSE